jgi:hypothetical protein
VFPLQCVDEFYEYKNHDENGRAWFKPKVMFVEQALHLIAVDVESKLLQMQRKIDDTIYKDDDTVKQELNTLLDNIKNGFVYFMAADAQQYVEYAQYNLQKLNDQVLLEKQMKKQKGNNQNVWWTG